MLTCEQSSGQDMFDHGIAVFKKYKDIYKYLNGYSENKPLLPSWVENNKEFILENLAPLHVVFDYTVHHDCGKPNVLQVDSEGKRHFPNHAEASAKAAKKIGLSKEVCDLIKSDMDFHLLKSEDLSTFASSSNAMTLLIVSIAEVLANAEMFGGFDSVSFKIKWKHIEKRGNQVLNLILKNKQQS